MLQEYNELTILLKQTHDLICQDYSPSDSLYCSDNFYHEMREWYRNAQPHEKANLANQATNPIRPPLGKPFYPQESLKKEPASKLIQPPTQTSSNPDVNALNAAPQKEKLDAEDCLEKAPLKSKKREKTFFLELHPMKAAQAAILVDIQTTMTQLFKNIPYLETPPNDQAARLIGNQWKKQESPPSASVLILSFAQALEPQEFLANLSKAINRYLMPAQLISAQDIESQNAWASLLAAQKLKLILVTRSTLQALPLLQQHYGASTQKGLSFLGHARLMLLDEESQYMQEPQRKAQLWQNLKALLPLTSKG